MTEGKGRVDDSESVTPSLGELSRLTGWLAHEINNPLGGLQNAFFLIRDAIPATHPHFKYVASIEREIARIASLTQRFRETYAYDEQRGSAVPLGREIAGALHALEALRAAREVNIELDLAAAAATELVGGELRRGAIRHLVQHAIESAAPGGTVRIAAWREGDLIWLSVPVRIVPPNEPRAPVAGPPGLALRMVEQLVNSMRGTVTKTSDDEGAGEIRIGLPHP